MPKHQKASVEAPRSAPLTAFGFASCFNNQLIGASSVSQPDVALSYDLGLKFTAFGPTMPISHQSASTAAVSASIDLSP